MALKSQPRFWTFQAIGDAVKALPTWLDTLNRDDADPDLILLFASNQALEDLSNILESFQESFPEARSIGCSCQGTIARGVEQELGPSVAVWVAELPGAKIQTFHLQFQHTADGPTFAGSYELDDFPVESSEDQVLIPIGDPFTFPMDLLLDRINEDYPGLIVIGGMASGASQPGETKLFIDGKIVNHGAVFARLANVDVCAVVSQGCRPIGDPRVVTSAERNEIYALGGQPATEYLMRVFSTLPTQEQRLVQRGLHIGIVINEYQESFSYGDFLIRNVIGVDRDQQKIVVADFVRVGQTVQFHIRDEVSADVDLRQTLSRALASKAPQSPKSALLFSCNGRGTHLFSVPNHDAERFQQLAGQMPMAGFFAAGEIGPVGKTNCMHGFTASALLFF